MQEDDGSEAKPDDAAGDTAAVSPKPDNSAGLATAKSLRRSALKQAQVIDFKAKRDAGGGGTGGPPPSGGGGSAEPESTFNPVAYGDNANELLTKKFTLDGYQTLLIDDEIWMQWQPTKGWKQVRLGLIKSEIGKFFDKRPAINRKGKPCTYHVNNHFVGNMLSALERCLSTPVRIEPPCWRKAPDKAAEERQKKIGPPDLLVPVANGLVNYKTMTLHPPTPAFFSHGASPVPLIRGAECPKWIRFLQEIFSDDQQMIDAAQEFFGYALTDNTSFQKILWIKGSSRSGKGVMARVLQALVGKDNSVGTDLGALGQSFGIQSFVGKKIAVFGETIVPEKADRKMILRTILSISGEDMQTIQRKFQEDWSGKLCTRLIFLSNELPEFGDTSNAFEKRILLLLTRVDFSGREDKGLTEELMLELPGILIWSVRGLQRLMERGFFKQPDASEEERRTLRDLSSPISNFLAECCQVGSSYQVDKIDLYRARVAWDREQGVRREITIAQFGKQLSAAAPKVRSSQPRVEGGRGRIYVGVQLNSDGLALVAKQPEMFR